MTETNDTRPAAGGRPAAAGRADKYTDARVKELELENRGLSLELENRTLRKRLDAARAADEPAVKEL